MIDMEWMIYPGAGVAVLGLLGLGYCIWRANQLRNGEFEGDALVTQLQRLIPINLASVFIATIGLALVVLGMLL